MSGLIDAALGRSRTVLMALVLILISGTIAYITIPKESDPDVNIPIIYVSMTHDGISPEDAERLLVRPMEKELRSIEGVTEMRSVASDGCGSVVLESEAGFDVDIALQDFREKVDIAQGRTTGRHQRAGRQRNQRGPVSRAGRRAVGRCPRTHVTTPGPQPEG